MTLNYKQLMFCLQYQEEAGAAILNISIQHCGGVSS
jgi:hypothetical protein